uniref:Uncharacterized protein n=1 Tax=Meloidogyne enterolobii TaxID=390850 RepID=A0A6V7TTE1_MELEN|nr:unnamed protein product [Meloidogyne enterolobii]
MGKELDDSLGVEKSGRVPSGPYDMHIDLKECYPNTKGVLTQHYSPHADKFVYYCTSTWYYRDCYEFYKACDVKCENERFVRLSDPPDGFDIRPCPGCDLWCATNYVYSCTYSCEKDVVYPNYNEYPLCNANYQPYDEGAEKWVVRVGVVLAPGRFGARTKKWHLGETPRQNGPVPVVLIYLPLAQKIFW